MNIDWSPLDRELERWQSAGKTLPIWWRDDDAVAPSAQLDRLVEMAQAHGLPVHLAVIPQGATQALAERVDSNAHVIPVVHGWAHESHAEPGEKKAEFSSNRALDDMRGEARKGLARLTELFGARLAPVFVPPWNRVDSRLVGELGGLGYRALSTFTPRGAAFAAPGLARINTHLDPIAWKSGRGLVEPDVLVAQMVRQMGDRFEGRADNGEPYGILTHHLVHDDAIWGFTNALLTRLIAGPVRRWTAAENLSKDNTE